MEQPTASLLQQIADNWMLVAMTSLYIGAILWALRPGTRAVHKDISEIPLRNDTLNEEAG